ncbi:hypothetical protein ACGGAQ_32050 [Micromonospora sp. NPDC047557]|uniref:hypothetical protein n=1 Tax=Micromonospora sp. NPDC047557 TaxID=3364250 RepID=UPI003724860F
MTELEGTYRGLLLIDPPLRRQWLLDRKPASVSPVHWWLALIDLAASDVRRQHCGWPSHQPGADMSLAVFLIDLASEHGFPTDLAIEQLASLIRIALDAGQRVQDLPASARPDTVARRAVDSFGMTREQAVSRAASLRAIPLTEDDFVHPGEDWQTRWQALTVTADYQDYHRLLNIDRILTNLAPLVDYMTDAHLVADVQAWLQVLTELDPVPEVITPSEQTPEESLDRTD